MNGNKIPDLQALEPELKSISSLTTLYLEANPCQSNDMTGYRRKIMLALPQLKQIDATYVHKFILIRSLRPDILINYRRFTRAAA